jgi:hypothetical protein
MLGRTVALLALNLFDAGMTLRAIARGAVEINPAMAALLAHGSWAFLIGKMVLVCVGVVVLWWYRRVRAAQFSMTCAVFMYSVLAAFHLWIANSI